MENASPGELAAMVRRLRGHRTFDEIQTAAAHRGHSLSRETVRQVEKGKPAKVETIVALAVGLDASEEEMFAAARRDARRGKFPFEVIRSPEPKAAPRRERRRQERRRAAGGESNIPYTFYPRDVPVPFSFPRLATASSF